MGASIFAADEPQLHSLRRVVLSTASYAPDTPPRSDVAELFLLPAESVTVELSGKRELWLSGPEDAGRVFPRVKYVARRWILEVADELRRHDTDRARRRADTLSECTRYSRVQVCACGTPHTGKLGTQEMRCHARSCPRCGPLRAHDMRRRIRAWMDGEGPTGAGASGASAAWWHITWTSQFDPYDDADCSSTKLHERLEGLKAEWRKWWRKNKGAAAFVGAEVGVWGEVHLHVMYCAAAAGGRPRLPIERVVDGRYRGQSALGFVDMPAAPIDDPARNVGEIVKYAAKTPGPKAKGDGPSWWSEPVVVPNPRLLGRWELATWGSRLVERYGAARSLQEVEPEPEPEQDPNEKCRECGAYLADFAVERRVSTTIWIGWALNHKVDPFPRRE